MFRPGHALILSDQWLGGGLPIGDRSNAVSTVSAQCFSCCPRLVWFLRYRFGWSPFMEFKWQERDNTHGGSLSFEFQQPPLHCSSFCLRFRLALPVSLCIDCE